ncbi:MAG TPA: hypothetical protein VMZ73_08670 [Acidimicrobiales bacterium]|nr:hypothetical protein [Acidimicrobiales bacterium]
MKVPSPLWLSGVIVAGGSAHFLAPERYARIVPQALGAPRPWVYASGVAEVAAGLLLALPRTRRVGGIVTAGVLVAVFPANVQMALDAGGIWWARLPFQVPLVWWAWRGSRCWPTAQARCDRISASSPAGDAGTE